MNRSLLLVIDVQNSFVNENTKPTIEKIEELVKSLHNTIINNLKRLIGKEKLYKKRVIICFMILLVGLE